MAGKMLKTIFVAGLTTLMMGGATMAATGHDFTFEKIEGGKLPMSTFKGKAVLVVNTASFCGYTPQYEGLERLWKSYKDQGLVILGVPANNFGGQEPGSNEEIKTFCKTEYDVDFPMTEKVDVVGSEAHPFYKWAKETLGAQNAPTWNFHKYLLGPKGELIAAFPTATRPDSADIKAAVEKALNQ